MIYKEGRRGDMVKRIQRAVGCYPDGIWGRLTTESVKAWQQAHSLKADGIAGPATLTAMGLQAVRDSATVGAKKSRREITDIIVHCSATPEGKAYTVEDIRKWHKQQGWSDIGYHYVVELDGSVRIGRNVDISGAHCEGHNAKSIGICYVGGLENKPGVPTPKQKAKDTRTDAQKAALLALLMDLRKLYPKARIVGHRDYDTKGKECPSFDAKNEYRKI